MALQCLGKGFLQGQVIITISYLVSALHFLSPKQINLFCTSLIIWHRPRMVGGEQLRHGASWGLENPPSTGTPHVSARVASGPLEHPRDPAASHCPRGPRPLPAPAPAAAPGSLGDHTMCLTCRLIQHNEILKRLSKLNMLRQKSMEDV